MRGIFFKKLKFQKILFQFCLAMVLWVPVFVVGVLVLDLAGCETGFAVMAQEKADEKRQDFATSYDVTYDIGTDGITTVTEKITLKNLTSKYYATQFNLTIGATDIWDVAATDNGGPLDVKSEKKGTATTLTIKFNQQVAGEGKTLSWVLNFKSRDFATKSGKVWEVSIPKIVSATNLESYNVTISVPTAFGQPTLISPTPKTQTANFDKMFLTYDKEALKDSGVSANFGTTQLFDFDLTYHLENPNLVTGITNIALPPDTDYQDVIYSRIEPKPENVTVDDDGNFLAWYKLKRGERMDIKVIGSAKLYATPKNDTRTGSRRPFLSDVMAKKYTAAYKYWEKDHQSIKTKLSEILGSKPPSSNLEKARLIYRYVVSSLTYDSNRLSSDNLERFGAVTALNNPTEAVCMEFTDLFIALARAADIPARELDGYAYTANPNLRPLSLSKDILHAWPEFWDKDKGWVMVDPTWENTTNGVDYFNKLDLNHLVFVVKGLSSEIPIPAGSYKYEGEDSKDVKVVFAEDDFLGKPQINVEVQTGDPIIAGFPAKLKVKVSNVGNGILPLSSFNLAAGRLTILGGENQSLTPVPAFGYAEFEYDLRTKSLVESFDDKIEIAVAGQKFQKEVSVRPFFVFKFFPFVLGGIVLVIVGLYVLVLGGLIYRKRVLVNKKKG